VFNIQLFRLSLTVLYLLCVAMLMLEDAGHPYSMDNESFGKIGVAFGGGDANLGYPAFALPILTRGNFSVSQTTAICEHLGRELGYYPSGNETITACMQLCCDAADVWSESYNNR
jgi:hypothetical protein